MALHHRRQPQLGKRLKVLSKFRTAIPICLRLLEHLARLAVSRTFWMAGSNRPTSTAMMAITTRSSINVKPTGVCTRRAFIGGTPMKSAKKKNRYLLQGAMLCRFKHAPDQTSCWLSTCAGANFPSLRSPERERQSVVECWSWKLEPHEGQIISRVERSISS